MLKGSITKTTLASFFNEAYRGSPPWDIGRPQAEFVRVANVGGIRGRVLDVGCGTGENAIFFAGLGHEAWGLDAAPLAIEKARTKAVERGARVKFVLGDALHLEELGRRFDTITDCGLFHVFNDEDRRRYVEGLATVLKPGGRLFLLCFSDEEPGTQGPRRVLRKEIEVAFAEGWKVESIEPSRFEVRPDLKDITFSEGGPKAWFVVVRRLSV